MQHKTFYFLFLLIILVWACDPKEKTEQQVVDKNDTTKVVKYAKRFAIRHEKDYSFVYVFGNRHKPDTTATFLIYTSAKPVVNGKNVIPVKSPCKKIAALSSIYTNMFYELGELDKLAAIDNIDYIINEAIVQKQKEGKLKEISKGIEIDLEQAIVLQPDMIFSFGMGDWEKDRNRKLERAGIPFAISLDHLEESPLARAEWIKFFAAFVNQDKKADSIFNAVEKRYHELTKLANESKTRPTVFNEIKYSDSWYMPGGKSYIAQLLKDAGANYLWKEDQEFGSLPLSFEQVFAKAKDADYWINLSTVKSKAELLSYEKRYMEFKAFKNGNLYNNNLITNAKGYSIYWENAMIFPDKILSDLIRIFHPELELDKGNPMNYYMQIH